MVDTIKIQNLGLITEVAASGDVQIFELNDTSLKEIGWMDAAGWPSGEMIQFMRDIDSISPATFEDGAKFWDQLLQGVSVYNHFFEDGENEEA